MNCKKCGAPLAPNDKFCNKCGETIQTNNIESQNNQYQNQPTDQSWQNYNNQPIYNQQMYNQQMYNQQQNKPSVEIKYILAGLAIVIIVVAIILIVNVVKNKDGNKQETVPATETSTQTATQTSTSKVKYENFTFEIPNNMVGEINDQKLLIYDEDITWYAIMTISEGRYSELKANKDQLKTYFEQSGISISSSKTQTINNLEFILFESTANGENMLIAYAQLNSSTVVGIVLVNQDNTFNNNALKQLVPVIKSAKTSSATNQIATNNKIDMNIIKNAIKE